MRYSLTQKGYLLYSLSQKKFLVSRDVVFKEDIFSFKQDLSKQQPLFPTEPISAFDDLPSGNEDMELQLPTADTDHIDVSTPATHTDITDEGLATHPHPTADTGNANATESDSRLMRNAGITHRKSTRVSHPLIWMKDYVTPTTQNYSQSNYVCYDNVSSGYRAYLSEFSTEVEPRTFEEAKKDQKWILAMQQEVQALEENDTWKIVELPQGKNVVGCKWVYKLSTRLMARLIDTKQGWWPRGIAKPKVLTIKRPFLLL